MKIFMKKGFIKKIAIICLFLVLFNFLGINQVHASTTTVGGKLLSPFMDLLVGIADIAYNIVNGLIMQNDIWSDSIIEFRTEKSETVSGWFKEHFVNWRTVFFGLSAVATSFINDAIEKISDWWNSDGSLENETITDEIDGTLITATNFSKDALPSIVYLPIFDLNLASIFAGDILTFDVNFFENKTLQTKSVLEVKNRTVDRRIEDMTYDRANDTWYTSRRTSV